VSNRWGNIMDFRGFDLITPNEREARFALGDQDTGVRPLAQRLFTEAQCRYLILKLAERGTLTYRSPGPLPREFFILDSFVDGLVDPIGAGDALLALSSLALGQSGDIVRASVLGSLAAAIACERAGNVPVQADEVARVSIDWSDRRPVAAREVRRRRFR
jgi:sugar/nucleoside kinase (ribokinase family)